MHTLGGVLIRIKNGFDGNPDSSCYNRVGRTLSQRGRDLQDQVVAFYTISGTQTYVHAAIETPDGVVIDDCTSQPPPRGFRDQHGRLGRADVERSVLSVSAVLNWLLTDGHSMEAASAARGGNQNDLRSRLL